MPGLFRPGRALSIARKEVRHILRDPFTLSMAIGLPLILVAFFGYVIDLDVKDIRIGIVDRDDSRASRSLAEIFGSSGYFHPVSLKAAGNPAEVLDGETVRAVLVVEPGFAREIGTGKTAKVQVLLDGADNSTAGVVMSYMAGMEAAARMRLGSGGSESPVKLETRFLFNPQLNSRWFVVPGLLVVVMSILSIMLTALTVAREWETGSMELLLSTPVRPAEIILGKLAPYLGLALLAVAFVYFLARFLLGVPFAGSHLIFLLGCLLFLIPSLAQGLLISVTLRQQTLATQIGLVSGLLPSMLLSGFIFPIESMPAFFRYLTVVFAPRWFIEISRGVFLRDAGILELAKPLGILLLIAFVLVAGAVKRFKMDVEP